MTAPAPRARLAPESARALTLERSYRAGVRAEIAALEDEPPPTLTEAELLILPAPVGRFVRRAGWLGRPHTRSARTVWQQMRLRRSPDHDWMTLSCEQFNSVRGPTRLALMQTRLGHLVPFEGLDSFQQGRGRMRMNLLRVVPLGEAHGRAMDESGLVTCLAELMLTPSLAFSPNISWTLLDERRAEARLRCGELSVCGVFSFDEADELVRFESDDRWQDGESPTRVRWSAEVSSYVAQDGVRRPHELSASWHPHSGAFTYVTGTIASIAYNPRD